jgi:hypothetical protein
MKEIILEGLPRPLVLFGVLLVGAGGFLLLYLGVMVFQVINNPEKVKLVEFMLRHIQIDDKAIFGSLNHKSFEIYFSKSFKAVPDP